MRDTPESGENAHLVYIKKWKRAKKAILLRNTNKVIQVMFQDQSELILCSGSGIVTFVNSKQEVKTMPLSAQNDVNLEVSDKSLYKRLQYAKEILVQMMSVQSMPPTLALTANSTNQTNKEPEENKHEEQHQLVAVAEAQNYNGCGIQKLSNTLTNMLGGTQENQTRQ